MWASAHKIFLTRFAATVKELLNKVIHRAVESGRNLKNNLRLPSILMFHFNFAALDAGLPLHPLSARIWRKAIDG